MAKVSIIIPTYNSEKYIRESLESAIYQTLDDIEIIIVDSNSKDKTLTIIEEYAKNDSRIKILHRSFEFVGVSRNSALDVATGDYVMFLDSDDFLALDACQKAYEQISKNNDDLVIFDSYEYIDENNEKRTNNSKLKYLKEYLDCNSFNSWEINTPFMNGSEAWYKIYKKSFLNDNNIRFSKEKFGEDTPFCIKAFVKANKISVLNRNLYYYRRNDNSSCSTCGEIYWNDIFETRPLAYEYILSSEHKNEFLNMFLPFIINSIMYWYTRWSKLKKFPKSKYYEKMHRFFNLLYINHYKEIEYNKNFINEYKNFRRIALECWKIYKIRKILRNILSITNNGRHKVFNILGIKIKIKHSRIKKNLKYLDRQYKLVTNNIRNKVKNNEKIRVAFYVNDSKWKCQNLFELMQKNPNYEPFMLVGKNSCDNYHREFQSEEEIKNIYTNFIKKGMNSFYAYNFKENKHIPLENFNPDIVFYSRQWHLDKIYSIDRVSKFALTCYVPYFIPNSPINIESGYDFHNQLWKYYVINEDAQKEYSKVMINKGKNLVPVGYPLLDDFISNKNVFNGDLVIYAPHWSLGNTPLKYATFDWNGKEILEFAKAHPNIKWVFKPHPILKTQLVEVGLMTPVEVENYYNEWDNIGIKYEGSDYLNLFKNSKALITDCGSFLAEYMSTKNPVILLRSKNATPYNFLAKKVTKYYYSVWNLEELDEWLEKIILQERDPWKERRLAMLDSLKLVNNASQNIINDFNKEFGITKEDR